MDYMEYKHIKDIPNSLNQEEHNCPCCGQLVPFDKKHKRYPIFCSKKCRDEFNVKLRYNDKHYCIVCGKLAYFNEKYKRWQKTCNNKDCIKQIQVIAQSKGVKNRKTIKIDKDVLYDLYITQNLTRIEIAKHFKCSDMNIKKWIHRYNIKKPKENIIKNIKSTKLKKYSISQRKQ